MLCCKLILSCFIQLQMKLRGSIAYNKTLCSTSSITIHITMVSSFHHGWSVVPCCEVGHRRFSKFVESSHVASCSRGDLLQSCLATNCSCPGKLCLAAGSSHVFAGEIYSFSKVNAHKFCTKLGLLEVNPNSMSFRCLCMRRPTHRVLFLAASEMMF